MLAVPPEVDVRKVDLSIELQILAYHEQRKANGLPAHGVLDAALTPRSTLIEPDLASLEIEAGAR